MTETTNYQGFDETVTTNEAFMENRLWYDWISDSGRDDFLHLEFMLQVRWALFYV